MSHSVQKVGRSMGMRVETVTAKKTKLSSNLLPACSQQELTEW